MIRSLKYLLLKCQAWFLLIAGQHGRALVRFEHMLQLAPHDRYALASRAHVLGQLGERSAAIEALQRLTAFHPQLAAGWFNLGFMLEEAGHLKEAGAAFARATEVNPALDRAWYGLALVCIRERRWDEAVAALQKNTQLQPMSPHGWYQLARVHVERQAPDEAIRVIRHLQCFEPGVAAQLQRETGLPGTLPV